MAKSLVRFWGLFGVLGVALILAGSPVWAQRGGTPSPRVTKGVIYDYDGEGRIDRMTDKDIVIGDRGFRLAPHVDYRDAGERWTSPANFEVGTRVGYRLNAHGEVQTLCLPSTDR